MIIILITPCFLSKQIKLRKVILIYEISIKINGNGIQAILYDTIETPSQLYPNEEPNPINGNKVEYDLSSYVNNIKMIWNSPLLN